MLKDDVPYVNKNVRAINIMSSIKPATLTTISTVQDIAEKLRTGYAQFPILNKNGQLVGSIPAYFLIVLIENRQWYRQPLSSDDPGSPIKEHGDSMDAFFCR